MITPEEFSILCLDEVRTTINEARGRNPLEVAMDRRIPHARLVATQVKYLARAERKLPSYAAAACIIPPRAFEQSSSERCAAHKRPDGNTVLDLTCGLGVDALYLSRNFKRVVTLERDATLADVARENFSRMGVTNIEVVDMSAEEYLAGDCPRFDWIYADPDRRSAKGRKMVVLADCSPDIMALMPRLKELAPRLAVKNSPLFDTDEALRLFPTAHVEVISLADECKEVMIYDDGSGPRISTTAIGQGTCTFTPDGSVPPLPERFAAEEYRFLVVPDVALQKARLARQALAPVADIWSDNGFGFARTRPAGVLGRVFEIDRIEKFDPKALKRELKGRGMEILKRDFPYSIEELMRRTGTRAGSEHRLALTKIGSDFWTIHLK